jgi:hypothetical protein
LSYHIDYSKRIFIDKNFLLFLKGLPADKSQVKFDSVKWLSYIKTTSSIDGEQNIMLSKQFKDLVDQKIYNENELKYICKPIYLNDGLDEDTNDVDNIAKQAIFLSDSKPYKIAILTNSELKPQYLKSHYLSEIRDIEIFGGDEACVLISNIFHNEYEVNK